MRAKRNPGFASIEFPQAQRAGPRRFSHPNIPVRASPISQLRSAISDSQVLDLRRSAFRRLPQYRSRHEPPNARIRRKWPATAIAPGLPVEASRCLPRHPRPRRVFVVGDQNRMVTIPDPRHIPACFPDVLPPQAAKRRGIDFVPEVAVSPFGLPSAATNRMGKHYMDMVWDVVPGVMPLQ